MSSTSIHLKVRETTDIHFFIRDMSEGGEPRPDTFLADTLNPDDSLLGVNMHLKIRGTS